VALSEASDLSGLARGLAFRVVETLGVLRRDAVAGEVKALDQTARAGLRKYGVRFGAFNIYIPALLKPAAADLLLLLWALHAGRNHGIDAEALPPRPQQGLTSVEADPSVPEPYWHAAGFQIAGARAIRIDMLERLSDLIRARVSWRPTEGGEPAPSGATGDGGFRAAPELMSVVGCSGEDFASILKALGFRRERRTLEPSDVRAVEPAQDGNGSEVPAPANETAAQPDIAFDEIWRPGKRNEARKPQAHQAKGKPRRAARQAHAPRQREERPRLERKERPRPSDSSPFAVLAELRRNLAARRPEGN
jgi:ATP-dependent RNA helicase SUPV3L1/SUV3